MTDQPEIQQMVREAQSLVVKLNTHLDLCKAQKITCHLELTGGRIAWANPAITRQREEETLWQGPEESDVG